MKKRTHNGVQRLVFVYTHIQCVCVSHNDADAHTVHAFRPSDHPIPSHPMLTVAGIHIMQECPRVAVDVVAQLHDHHKMHSI